MIDQRTWDLCEHMRAAASDALAFTLDLSQEQFRTDKRTQQAVLMSLMIVGEVATKIAQRDTGLVESNPNIPWQSMRGMRNRIVHGYFDVDLDVVWVTVQTALPRLIEQLNQIERASTASK